MFEWLTGERTPALSARDQERVRQYYPSPLTYELKVMGNFPRSRWEERHRKTEVEDQPPGEWFSPFNREMKVPAWLNAEHAFFTGTLKMRVRTLFRLNSGAEGWQIEYPVPAFTLNAAIWFYESLLLQCVFEQWRRGLPIQHEMGSFRIPEFTEDGWPIVEQEEREDGSVWAVIAEPGDDPAAPEDIKSFEKAIAWYYRHTPFKGVYRLELISPAVTPYRQNGHLTGYPLGRPNLNIRRLRGPDPNRNPYTPVSTVHGSAQWAWRDELARKGLIDLGEPGRISGHTFLGRVHHPGTEGETPPLNHLAAFGGEGHRLIVGSPGSGKFTTAIAPLLLWSGDRDSAFIFDIKNGEAAKLTAEHRATLGPVTVLDPFGATGLEAGCINPLDLLREDDPMLVVLAERLADAIFVPGNAQDQFWDMAARKVLVALLIHIGTSPVYAPEERNLRTLRDIVRDQIPDEVLLAMKANLAGDGEVAAQAKVLLKAEESDAGRMRYSILETLNVNIGFLRVPQILSATARTTFDPRQLKERVSTLYLVTPQVQFPTVSRWARLIYVYVMEQLRESEGGPDVHVVLDEFPTLGKFERVVNDLALSRSAGLHMHVVVQSLDHLKSTYGTGWERIQGTCALTQVLGVSDNATAEHISKMLGTTTIKTQSKSRQRNAHGGGGQSEGESFAARPLMTPGELLGMDSRQAVAIIGGMNPVKLEKVGYFE